MPITYRKTAKGVAEIETRQHGLSPRWRAALILIDGKRNRDVLAALIPLAPDDALAALLDQGFIEAVSVASAPAPKPAVSASRTPAAAAPRATASPELATRCREVVRDLNEILGPAAETMALRIERARDDSELRPLLLAAAQVIASARGRAAAEAFFERHDA